LIAGCANGIDQLFQAVSGRFDAGLFTGQVDADAGDIRHLGQGALDPPSAAGAGHAADGQVEGSEAGHGWSSIEFQHRINLAMWVRSSRYIP
jgi:hypothetical protein